MKMSHLVWSVFLFLTSIQGQAQERNCIGAPNLHAITLASDGATDGSLTVRRSIDGVTKEELFDDTGYISASLLTASLIQKGKEKSITTAERADTVRLLRLRLKKFKEILIKAGIAADAAAIKAIDRVDATVNQSTITKSSLSSAWTDLNSALSDGGIHVTARARKPGTSQWGKEEPLSEFTMPTLAVIRGLSCTDTVGDLQIGDALEVSISKSNGDNGKGPSELKGAKNQKGSR